MVSVVNAVAYPPPPPKIIALTNYFICCPSSLRVIFFQCLVAITKLPTTKGKAKRDVSLNATQA
jgi:hypothetical protein